MDRQETIELIAEILDCDIEAVKPESALDSLGWDSMAMLGVIAMAKTRFNKRLTGAQIRTFVTIEDILSALE